MSLAIWLSKQKVIGSDLAITLNAFMLIRFTVPEITESFVKSMVSAYLVRPLEGRRLK